MISSQTQPMTRPDIHRLGPYPRWLLLFGALLTTLFQAPEALAERAFEVVEAETRLVQGSYQMNAQIDYDFSDQALEALDNGVPLTLDVHLRVRERGSWIWSESLVDRHLRFRIRYLPLSGRYRVQQLPDDNGETYVTRDAAIAALGEIRSLQLLDQDQLDPRQRYELQLKASLDIEELPLPLRPFAYLYPAWKHTSRWSNWPLTP